MFGWLKESDTIRAQRAWHSAKVVTGYDSNIWRKDAYGTWIRFADFGKRGSAHGWDLTNSPYSRLDGKSLCPVQYRNKSRKEADNRSSWLGTLMSFMF